MKSKIKEILDLIYNENNGADIGLYSNGLSKILLSHLLYNYKFEIFELENNLESIFYNIETLDNVNFSFSNGLSGIGWLLLNLDKINSNITIDIDELFKDIDNDIIKWMKFNLLNKNYDFIIGAIGAAFYLLKITKANNSIKLEIKKGLKILFSNKIKLSENNIAWLQLKDNYYIKNDNYNFGLSHGIPSILVFLVKCYEEEIDFKGLKNNIKATVNFLLSNIQDFSQFGSYFPYSIDTVGNSIKNSRLAWCYGDLGVCISLWHANKILNDNNLESKIIEILLFNAKKRNLKECGVVDAGFCHGSVGIAHIYRRFHERYSCPEFLEASNYWYQVTLNLAVHKDGLAGYKAMQGKDKEWIKDFGMLEGIAGIAASLHYAQTGEDPWWDEMFLIS